jgi:hypothetical protein
MIGSLKQDTGWVECNWSGKEIRLAMDGLPERVTADQLLPYHTLKLLLLDVRRNLAIYPARTQSEG